MLIEQASNQQLALTPLAVPLYLLLRLLGNPIPIVRGWFGPKMSDEEPPPMSSQLLAYMIVGISGYVVTDALVPNIKQYTLRKGISGKDLGKRGTVMAEKDM